MKLSAPPVEGQTWLTTAPLNPDALDRRAVVLAFWSAGCEGSIGHLHRLNQVVSRTDPLGRHLALIGVHSPRFPYSRDEVVAAETLSRERLDVVCVHDPDFITWNRYNPTGWPFTVVIDHDQQAIGAFAGIMDLELMDSIITGVHGRAVEADSSSTDRRPRSPLTPRVPKPACRPGGSLLHPCGVAVGSDGRLAIADSGHDRVLIGTLNGERNLLTIDDVIDGLARPTALAWVTTSALSVVESGAQRVVAVNLNPIRGEEPTIHLMADHLIRPCDVAVDSDGSTVIADAGAEVLIRVRFQADGTAEIGPIAGCGISGILDGPAERARLAQPVSVSRAPQGLAFCDAASSNLRTLSDSGRVTSITTGDFYSWGLVDGPVASARFQRPGPLRILPDGSMILIDLGNNRLRRIRYNEVQTLGLTDLNHPGGLAPVDHCRVVVADTGNHRLVMVDVEARQAWLVDTTVEEPAGLSA